MKINFKTIKKVFLLGLPIIISNLSRTLMDLADMAMVAGIDDGANALAAVGFSGMLVWIFLSMGLSIRTCTQTIAARRVGQKIYPECSLALRNGQILALSLGLPLSILGYFFAPQIMSILITQQEIPEQLKIKEFKPCVVGLYTDPERLSDIRRNRVNIMNETNLPSYADLDSIKKEIENSKKIFKKYNWPTVDVTRKSVEETAASVIKIYEIKKENG
mgnify:CR=1 FL=1